MPNNTTISTARYRVQLHPATGLWMRGARFGWVIREYRSPKTGESMVVVQIDHPAVKRPVRMSADNVMAID